MTRIIGTPSLERHREHLLRVRNQHVAACHMHRVATEDRRAAVRSALAAGMTLRQIAELFEVAIPTVHEIAHPRGKRSEDGAR